METLLETALSNAVAAVVLAVLAAGVGCVCRRPALVHGLWLLVLLKLVTPPLVVVPIVWERPAPAPLPEPVFAWPEGLDVEEAAPADLLPLPDPLPDVLPPPLADPAPVSVAVSWRAVLAGVWLAGSAGWFVLAGVRLRRFGRLLRHATRAPDEMQREAGVVAERLGLRCCPGVWLVPGRLTPMLWAAAGRPRLLLPEGLLSGLAAEGRRALLAHELAHLRRCDHWVRGLELVVRGLYWWHPVVWWACRELREAEEQCCDAWVVAVLPGSGRAYAEALLDALDFLSVPGPAAPPLASGLGRVSDVKRRLTMILRGATPRGLGWAGGLALCVAGAVLLPLLPAWVQAEEKEKPTFADLPARVRTIFNAKLLGEEPKRPADVQEAERDRALDAERAALKQAEAELRRKLEEVRAAQERAARSAQGQKAQARVIHIAVGGDFKPEELKEVAMFIEKRLGARVVIDRSAAERIRFWHAYPTPPSHPAVMPPDRMENLERQMQHLMRQMEEMRREMHRSRPDAPAPTPRQP